MKTEIKILTVILSHVEKERKLRLDSICEDSKFPCYFPKLQAQADKLENVSNCLKVTIDELKKFERLPKVLIRQV